MAKDGSLRSLVIAADGLNPQPRLRVGVATAGKGQLDVSPVVYESEADRNIQLVFTAQGPMYDYAVTGGTDVDSSIQITIPTGLTAPQTTTNNGDGFITVSRQSGTVLFADPNNKITVAGQVATIDISRMENGAKIYIAYRKVDVAAGVTAARFEAQAASVSTTPLVDVTEKPDGDHVRTITGSGEITLSNDVVGAGTKPTLTFTYKAATKLTDAVLIIDQPASPWVDRTLQSGDSRMDNYVSFSGGGDAVLDLTRADNAATTSDGTIAAGDAITLTGVDLNAGASVTVRITRTQLTSDDDADPANPTLNGVYAWPSTLNGSAPADTLDDPSLYVVGDARASVVFAIIPTADADPATADPVALPHYNAASKENIRFRFTTTTPIKGGYVQFTIPSGWAAPSLTDVAGKATVQLVDHDGTAVTFATPTGADDAERLAVSGNTITVHIKASPAGTITVQYGKGDGANRGMVQNRAVDNLEIVGRFKTGSSSGVLPASAPVSVRVGNVAAGSGTAMITTPSSHKVEAGSADNTIRIVYRAAGTMNGGTVRLHTPEAWGELDERASDPEKNHIRVVASTSAVNQADISYGPRWVLVPLMNVQVNNTVEFVLSNVKAQTTIGLAEFTVESAGGPSDSLMRLTGEALPKDADDKNITDPYMLLGKVYVPRFATGDTIPGTVTVADAPAVMADTGVLRLEVVAGAGGTGEASLLEIVRSDAGLRNYLNADDDALVSDRRVHAGDEEIYLVFKYTPVQTIADGALRFTVPTDWTSPQEDSSNTKGYTTIQLDGANTGAPSFENRVVTIPIVDITSSDSIEIHYGSGSFGAAAPTVKKTSEFLFAVKGTGGSFNNIGAVEVEVHSQASGEGSASIEAMNATAGAPDGSITITYDPIGQIANGRIKLTVDEALTGGAEGDGVTASHISVSTGSTKYGGSVDLDLDANADVTKNDVLVSGVSLGADAMFTFTYEGMMPEAAGDLSFTVAVDGGEGPGEVLEGAPAPTALIDGSGALTVTVGDAAAGSGTVSIDQDPGAIAAGSSGNTITVTYTAIGSIGEGKTITVAVPDGWSAPLNEAATDPPTKMGTFTVMHLLKLADDDADGMRDEGSAVAASTMKAAGAAADAMDTIMVATVGAAGLAAGDSVVFTYSNADAPAMPEVSMFTTSYDSMQAGTDDDVKVIVQSEEGATKLMLEAADFNIDNGGSTTVTVKTLAADDSVATSSTDTVVTLTASAPGSIAASVTIAAGEYDAETELTATAAANITVTASATDLTDAEIMVHADTDNTSVDSVTATPAIAKAGDTVTVSVTGTPAQDATFSVGSIVTDASLMEDEAGSYTGTFMVVADLHADDDYTITAALNGASGTGTLTIDSTAPTVTASTDAGDTVGNGDTITITAMVTEDGSGVASVMADVSMLDTTQSMVALAMGDDGSYSAEVTISEDNEAANGTHAITVMATDNAGNESEMATAEVTLQNTLFYTSTLPAGISLYHVPLMVDGLDTVGDLETMLGESVNLLITYDGTSWNSRSSGVAITADLGILVSLSAETTITLEGRPWGDGDSMINLAAGSNLIGLPVNDARVTNVSDIMGLFDEGVVSNIIVSSGGEFQLVAAAGDPADGPVAGDAAYLVMASAAGSAMVSGDGWENGSASAAPIALVGYTVDTQTPVLDVHGSVVDEITGLAKEGFRVKVKNLSTKAALSSISSVEVAEGYNMTFVDLADSYAARVGDVLEISADSPNPLIGVQPVRHIVTVDDVKNSTIQLENLIAYEIPAETALLNNYPNPFNPETWIPYHLSEDADVKLTIYDVNGEVVRDIDVGHQTAAKYDTRSKAIYWDGRNRFGEQVASGVYFYHLQAGDFSGTRKMVILK